ncbi:MAG: hypothetical protein PUI85_04010 [Eubacteriales bacterium]|nr:hypothetical protein [Eubacteriales bacterium]
MKKLRAIMLAIAVLLITNTSVMAAGLEIVKTSPKNGDEDIPLENMGVKITFNKDVFDEKNNKANKNAVKIVDKKGKEIKSKLIFSDKEKKVALVIADSKQKIDPVSKYSVVVDSSFKAADGTMLGKEEKITFKTLNPSTSMKISMAMMLVMVVGMIVFSSRSMKKQMKDQEKQKTEKVNPYKVAKKTGKSVEDVVNIENKKKEKAQKKAREEAELEEDMIYEEPLSPGHFRVATKRTVAQGGSKYITGRKAEAEKKATKKQTKKNKKKNK